jgi:hypothetical protein
MRLTAVLSGNTSMRVWTISLPDVECASRCFGAPQNSGLIQRYFDYAIILFLTFAYEKRAEIDSASRRSDQGLLFNVLGGPGDPDVQYFRFIE